MDGYSLYSASVSLVRCALINIGIICSSRFYDHRFQISFVHRNCRVAEDVFSNRIAGIRDIYTRFGVATDESGLVRVLQILDDNVAALPPRLSSSLGASEALELAKSSSTESITKESVLIAVDIVDENDADDAMAVESLEGGAGLPVQEQATNTLRGQKKSHTDSTNTGKSAAPASTSLASSLLAS